jgi:hypothetical protein
MASDEGAATGRPKGLLVGGAALAVAAVPLFLLVDAILAAFVGIMGLTLLGIGAMAGDWDRHSTFEDREMARARRRKEKWERGSEARARDRARWEAHQARQAGKAGKADR